MLIERALLDSPEGTDYTVADDFMGWGPGHGKARVAPTLVKHGVEKARGKASVYKEVLKYNEELRLRKPPKGPEKEGLGGWGRDLGRSRPAGWAFSLVSSPKGVTSRVNSFLYLMFLRSQSLVPTFPEEFDSGSRDDRATVDHLYDTINSFRPPSQTASDEEAMRALLGNRVPYGGDDDLTVVPYDRALVSIPGDGRVPVPLTEVLPPDAAKMIVDFDTHLLKDANQWGAEVEHGLEHIGSYMDPRLRFSRRSYLNFIGDLIRGSSWADVVMDTDSDMYLSLSDVKDYFYACGLPPGLESFFCLPDITGEELKVVTQGDPSFRHLWGPVAVAPAMRVMPTGWTWSFFAQVLHVHQVHQIRPWVSGAAMQDRVPPPPFRTGTELALPYCDNFAAAASSPAQADALREDSKRRMTSLGFEVHEEEAARPWAESLGFAIDGLTGEHRPSPAKARRLRQVCRRVSRQRPWLSGRQLERLLGHATFQFLGHRPLLSIFRSCYTFAQCHYLQPLRLWRTAAEELRAAAALLPFARANMRRPWASEVEVFDACLAGCGIMTATLPKDVVSEIGKVDERWRYAFQYEQPGGPREHALRSAPPVEECFSNAET
ncbi:unnamed protein product, partial [Prorocentrum cordatum]